MIKISILFFLFCLWSLTQTNSANFRPRTYQINLDLPPIDRWRDFISENKRGVSEYVKASLNQYNISSWNYKLLGYLASYHWDREFIEELKAISDLSGVEFGRIVLLNYIYELNAYCTSIVARDENGTIIHGRNLDYDFREEIMNSTGDCEFYKNGTLLFKASVIAGQPGTHTGMRPNGWAISLNQRKGGGFESNLYEAFLRKTIPTPYLIRKILEQEVEFQGAVKRFSEEELIAPAYFIVSGKKENEGAVITRDRKDLLGLDAIDKETWFLVQTNFDRAPLNKGRIDIRRKTAEARMTKISEITPQNMFDEILSRSPNFNSLTIMTATMIPKNGYFNTTMWKI